MIKPYSVLYFDDNPADLSEHLLTLKQELKATIQIATTYRAAQQLLETHTFDIFILDIEICGERTTGIQLADYIRCLPQYTKTPIIFCSMYSHYSYHLLSSIQNCKFISKPFTVRELISQIGCSLGIPSYIEQYYHNHPLMIPVYQGGYIEVDPKKVSYIELIYTELIIQYINGTIVKTKCNHGCFKDILNQIDALSVTHLKQIYRSIIINVDQIKTIYLNKNIGSVQLFNDDTPKPIGSHYRQNLADFY